ncbi:helix-turn-helix domain-containing protein [Azospirillum sp. B2RO_4]|uniref:helix-turn-helix domain-containing protein n=1 Tax=Azospirillum sp. B2RO_4 TaxID=3027796 RepID=UPI003DA8277F
MTSLDNYLRKLSPESQAKVAQRAEEIVQEQMRLGELRASMGVSQATMAEALGVKQPRVSKIENRGDMSLSLVRRYVEQLGGRLDVVATFGNGRRVQINALADIERVEDAADTPMKRARRAMLNAKGHRYTAARPRQAQFSMSK